MCFLIFCFWRATVLTFLKNGLKLLKDKALEIVPKYGRTEAKVGIYFWHHIYFYLDDSELQKQYHSVSQEMMEQICNLETVKPQEILIKVCVTFYYIEICC